MHRKQVCLDMPLRVTAEVTCSQDDSMHVLLLHACSQDAETI
jgi:hypothetical protein